jgi:hypothetical protein
MEAIMNFTAIKEIQCATDIKVIMAIINTTETVAIKAVM